MAVTLTELVDSREWSGGSVTFHYVLTGTSDDVTAKSLLLGSTPTTYNTLVREANPSLSAVWVDTAAGDGQWDCTLRYNPPEDRDDTPPEIGTVRIRGSTKGGTQHIIAALDTVGAYGDGATADDFGDLIGVTDDSVEGVDIGVGSFDFNVTKVFAPGALPALGTLYGLSWHVNNAGFSVTDTVTGLTITLAAGECLFKGADFGDVRGDGGMEFSYDFSALPNATGLSVGPIGGISKKGWEYLWVRYKTAKVGTLKAIGKIPRAAYVCKTYKDGNFAGLGL